MIFIGIDPGKQGAIAALDFTLVGRKPILFAGSINHGKDYNIPDMVELLKHFKPRDPLVVIERATARPGQGVVSMFTFGKGYGIWLGILAALGIPYQVVHPSVWTKRMLLGSSGAGKNRGVQIARQLFPQWQPKTKKEEGYADAILLAEYAHRISKGQG